MSHFTPLKGIFAVILSLLFLAAEAQPPANQPAAFTATTLSGTSVKLSWPLSTGGQLPTHYVVLARVVPGGTFVNPTDGSGPTEDTDLADNLGTHIEAHGAVPIEYDWTGLPADTDFEFKLIPYNNASAGTNPRFLVAGARTATASTKKPSIVLSATPVTGIDETVGTIHAEVTSNHGSALTERGVKWGYSAGALTNTSADPATTVGTFTRGLTGLNRGDEIFYAAYATSTAGTTTTAVQSFFTYAQLPDNQIAFVTATATSSSTIHLDFPPISSNGPHTAGYIILRREGNAPTDASLQDGKAPANLILETDCQYIATITNTSIDEYDDSGLTPTTNYFYTVVPYNIAGAESETINYKVGTGIKVHNDLTFSKNSDIVLNTVDNGTQATLNYRTKQPVLTAPPNLTFANTLNVAKFIIRDGGASSDGDGKPTIVNSITIDITNFENIHSVGLFDDDNGNTLIGEWDNINTGWLTFTLPTTITVADNTQRRFTVRTTFRPTVTDNQQIHISITGAGTAPGSSEFTDADAGGATTSGAVNKILVTATKLLFVSPPTSAPVNTNFDLTVWAVDNIFNNRDLDYTGSVTLKKSGDPNNLQPSGGLTKSFVNGQGLWTGASAVRILFAGTFTLSVDDGDLDGETVINITSPNAVINATANQAICYGSTYHNLDPIRITEADNSGFSVGTNRTFSLALPSGFIFDTGVGSGFTVNGSDISTSGNYDYPQPHVVQVTFTVSGTANINYIEFTGLRAAAPHPGGTDAPKIDQQPITRLGGTAVIPGDVAGTEHGKLTADDDGAPGSLGFTVSKVNAGDVNIDANETRFSINGNAVRLSGTPTGGVFSGPGVTLVSTEYRFNPATLAAGTYNISYKATTSGCDFVYVKTFQVYSSEIDNLAQQYCTNDSPSPALSVDATLITSTYGASYFLQKFVYWRPAMPALGIPFGSWQDMPVDNKFDPGAAAYQPIYPLSNPSGGPGIYIGWVATNGVATTGIRWLFIPVRSAPVPSIQLSKTTFCADDPPVTLIGIPANSNDAGADHFDPTSQSASISSGGTPRVWTFTPSNVTGATAGNPRVFDITYVYRNQATGCTGESAPVRITVVARPTTIPLDSIVLNRSQAVCQGVAAATVRARGFTTTTYKWYADQALTQEFAASSPNNEFTPASTALASGTYNYYVTRTIHGCESNRETVAPTTARSIALIVNASPLQPVPNFTREYCAEQTLNTNDFQITAGSGIKWYSESLVALPVTNGTAPTLTEIQNNLLVSTASPTTYVFNVTQTVNNCEGIATPTKVTIVIKPRPDLNITPDDGVNAICKTDPILTLSAFDGGSAATVTTGIGVWTGIGAVVGNPGTGTAQINPSLLDPGEYEVKFSFINNTTQCSNERSINLRIKPTITADLVPLDFCEKLFVRINNKSEIDMGTLGGLEPAITKTEWNFGDGTGLAAHTGDVLNDPRTHGTYFSPEHLFSSTGSFLLQYTMTTADGCVVSASEPLIISPKPNASFTWREACMNTISETKFLATTSPVLPISTYAWTFNKAGNLTFINPGAGNNPTVNYTSTGRDSVRLIVTTTAQCKDTVQHPVFIVPAYSAIDTDNSYTQDFDNGSDGWIDGGKNSSWEIGKPNETNIQTVGPNNHAWDTNLDGTSNPQEQSYVLSPCFDFTQSVKPILSMDIWSDTPLQNDGAVLQYNTNGNLLDETSWTVLGQTGEGANWYDESGISSSPGNQADTDVGWTGAYGGWRHAAYKLDDLKGETKVVFRIAFASNIPRRDGFAFDNIFIGERTRTVLLESFTNSSAAANTKTHNDLFRGFSNNSQEIAKVEYHTAFPGQDPINAMNTAINGSRAAFYGLSSTGTFTLDGQVATNVANLSKIYDDRVLTPSSFRIDINLVKDGPVVRISTTVTNITNLTLPVSKANVFTVLVEKSITEPSMLGSNGDPEFVYVARKMLPNAAGTPIGQDIGPLGTFNVPDVTWDELGLLTSGNGAIVVFIQSTEGDNKNVFQAALVDATQEPEITTGNELPEWEGNIRIFPNPANGTDITIALPEKAKQTLPVTLIDAQGRNMLNTSIAKGNAQHTVTTSTLSNGFYIVEIETEKGRFVRKKIMVMH